MPLYWIGNAAKSRVTGLLVEEARRFGALTVVDYGCGLLGDWPRVVADTPGLEIIGFDPDPVVARGARERAAGIPIRVVSVTEFAALHECADRVVSFSVFEHVVDRPAYLRDCRRLLKHGGVVYLSYDDGHFRDRLEYDRAASILKVIRAFARNALALPIARVLGRPGLYQRAVEAEALAAQIAAAGLRVRCATYENLADFKHLIKTMPAEHCQDFVRFWLEVEARLNEKFAVEYEPYRGDRHVLWRACMTRTLELVRTDDQDYADSST